MSRIRIVGGTLTKTTGGDHNIYSDGNIVYSSGKAITESSDTGITYGEPKKAPMMSKIKKIFNIKWMCAEMKDQISTANIGSFLIIVLILNSCSKS